MKWTGIISMNEPWDMIPGSYSIQNDLEAVDLDIMNEEHDDLRVWKMHFDPFTFGSARSNKEYELVPLS